MATKSLLARDKQMAKAEEQIRFLSSGIFSDGELPTFTEKVQESGEFPMQTNQLEILQINLGYMCNQVCAHCHVDAGPDRKEIMTKQTMQECLGLLQKTNVHTIDLTGGAPEMNPNFRWFVEEAAKIGVEDFIVRSNLTIIEANKKYNDLPDFFKKHNIHVVSSMPHYTKGKTDKQRGNGVFNQSIKALKRLNAVGYGQSDSNLKLDLVYNPSGAFLPANQESLEKDFKKNLLNDFGIVFNELMTITNLPISRFLDYLIASENYEDYMFSLVEAFNPATLKNVMCKNTLSVSWNGWLYDCDFNQMLEMKIDANAKHISEFNPEEISNRKIRVGQHCYGCTAGAGSSCQGSVV
ncbi:MAG: arsenosugar biosynthesis radical SAM (seleno)protein ArsS [Bacteroidota bacterium]